MCRFESGHRHQQLLLTNLAPIVEVAAGYFFYPRKLRRGLIDRLRHATLECKVGCAYVQKAAKTVVGAR